MSVLQLIPGTGVLLSLLTAQAGAQAAQELKIQWQPGMRYVQRLEIRQSGTLPAKEGTKSQHASITADEVVTVRPHKREGWRTIGVQWTAFRIEGANGDAKFAYNSANPGKGPDKATNDAGNAARQYLNREFIFQIDTDGEISATPEFDALLAEIVAKAPQASAPVKAFFTEGNLTQLLRLGNLPASPAKAVEAGAAWPFETLFEIPIVGDLTVTGTCTLQGRGKKGGADCCVVPLTGKLELMSGPAASLMGLKDARGTVTGSVWFDPALCWARESVTSFDVVATLGGIAANNDGSPKLVPLKQTMKFSLLRAEKIKT